MQPKYFVLRPRGTDWHAAASRAAMRAYAEIARADSPELAADVLAWAVREEPTQGEHHK